MLLPYTAQTFFRERRSWSNKFLRLWESGINRSMSGTAEARIKKLENEH